MTLPNVPRVHPVHRVHRVHNVHQRQLRWRVHILLAALAVVLALLAALALTAPARALPEYSAQTGEPCATCHISPSGGGLRTPRGQAWVGSHRPGTVPALEEALALLGVHLDINEADFVAPANAARPAEQPHPSAPDRAQLRQWLSAYEGN